MNVNGQLTVKVLERTLVEVWRDAEREEREGRIDAGWDRAFYTLVAIRSLVARCCGTKSKKYEMVDAAIDIAIYRPGVWL